MNHLQFSVRGLLVLTTIVSVCLAIGVHFAGFMFVVIAVGLAQVAMMLSADWLIQPRNRQMLAFATAASWTTLASGMLVLGIRALYSEAEMEIYLNSTSASSVLGVALIGAGAVCYLLAIVRWRQLSKRLSNPK